MRLVAALAAGLVFGAGLSLSRMIDPAVVLAFLDVAAIADGSWNPALAFVMAGAILVTAIGYALIFRRRAPLLAPAYVIPSNRFIDGRLIAGAMTFGDGLGTGRLLPRSRHSRAGLRAGEDLALRWRDARRNGCIISRSSAGARMVLSDALEQPPAAAQTCRLTAVETPSDR